MGLAKKVVLITGAASGMGAACARLFAAAGAKVVIVDRNGVLSEEIAQATGAGAPLVGDVSDSSFCDGAVATAVARYGRLDILVNAAGIIVRADADHTSDADWQVAGGGYGLVPSDGFASVGAVGKAGEDHHALGPEPLIVFGRLHRIICRKLRQSAEKGNAACDDFLGGSHNSVTLALCEG